MNKYGKCLRPGMAASDGERRAYLNNLWTVQKIIRGSLYCSAYWAPSLLVYLFFCGIFAARDCMQGSMCQQHGYAIEWHPGILAPFFVAVLMLLKSFGKSCTGIWQFLLTILLRQRETNPQDFRDYLCLMLSQGNTHASPCSKWLNVLQLRGSSMNTACE